jgi:nitrogenase molybdenum-iron protein NifN
MEAVKPLQVNPFKLSQPMGATLAFLGVKGVLPLMHSAQGCTSFTKVFYTRHFNEPIPIQTTAINDITAVIDGGDIGIKTAIDNILKSTKPSLIGLFTTGLSETKGDDIKSVVSNLDYDTVYVNTPDYEGGLESGFALTIQSLIEQLVEPKNSIDETKITVLPNVNMQPIEVEELKEFLELFGYSKVYALPDLSDSLDGHLQENQGKLTTGGIEVNDIKMLADSKVVITVGASTKYLGEVFREKNSKTLHIHMDSLTGLEASDQFVQKLLEIDDRADFSKLEKWRNRLRDAMLDSHFSIGKARVAIALEPDSLYGLSKALKEVGAQVSLAVSSTESELLSKIEADRVFVGDLEDIENSSDEFDILITNYHGERIAHRTHKKLVIRGFPNYEEIGSSLKSDILYKGSCYLLFEIANILSREH